MTVDQVLRDAVYSIMSDRRQRSAKEILNALREQGYESNPVKVARICASIPGIRIVGKWNNRSEYRMVD